jgi:arsenical pump membrane protein
MGVVAVGLLAAAVLGAVLRPWRVPSWKWAVAGAGAGLVSGTTTGQQAGHALRTLAGPLAFLLAAVPLAVLLDELGFFEALSGRIAAGPRLWGGLWTLAAGVTTVLNLDAAVVLLTPLYVRIARRHHLDPVALGFQPVLLASLASSALPVSNLTNLIVASHFHLGVGPFVRHLALPSAVATGVGWLAYRRVFRIVAPPALAPEKGSPRALILGGGIVALVMAGFLAADRWSIPLWCVVAAADVALVVILRSVPLGHIPLRTSALAAGLAVLAAGAAPHLGIGPLLAGDSAASLSRTVAVSAVGANVLNNLPALLVAVPHLGPTPTGRLWAVLLGVNVGPTLVFTGTLAALLWMDTMDRLGVSVSPRQYTKVGIRVGLPALVAAAAVVIVLAR